MDDSDSNSAPNTPNSSQHVVVIGTGFFGNSITSYIRRVAPEYTVTQTSRSLTPPPEQCVQGADIVFLAVPSHCYPSVSESINSALQPHTILIDVANRPLRLIPFRFRDQDSSAITLHKLVPQNVHVVKAFNTVSANYLTELNEQDELPGNENLPFAANDQHAIQTMKAFCKDLQFNPLYRGTLEQTAPNMEHAPHRFFPLYKTSFIMAGIIWTWWILYSTLSTYVIHGRRGTPSRPWDKYPLSMFMATTGETSMTLFATVFLAGPVATALKRFGRRFPNYLINWLNRRKQIGLVAFLFASAHGIAGAISSSHIDDGWKGQFYFVLGILSYLMFAVLAVYSSGQSGSKLTWAEFRGVFSWVGTLALMLGVVHQGFWGAILLKHRPNPSYWVANGAIMPISWLGIIFPIFVLVVRGITWLPCFREKNSYKSMPVDTREVEAISV